MRRLVGSLTLLLFLGLPLLGTAGEHCVSHGEAPAGQLAGHELGQHPAPDAPPADCSHCPPTDCAVAAPCGSIVTAPAAARLPDVFVGVQRASTTEHSSPYTSRDLEPGLPPPRAATRG